MTPAPGQPNKADAEKSGLKNPEKSKKEVWKMITFIICGVIGIAAYVCVANGEWLSAGICAAIIIGLLIFRSAVRDDTNAQYNATQYWAMDGKDRAKARHKWEAQAREEERREAAAKREREQKELQKKARLADERLRQIQEERAKQAPPEKTVTCRGCGQQAREDTRVTYPSGATYVTYTCPWCGEKKTVKV